MLNLRFLLVIPLFLMACSGTFAAPKSTATHTPEPTATPVAFTFNELADIYETVGTTTLDRKRVRLEGIISSLGVGTGGWTGDRFTTASLSISNIQRSGPAAGINPQTGQILRPSRLSSVTCQQRTDKMERWDRGIWQLDEDPPVWPWSTETRIVVEGTLTMRADGALVYINDCTVLQLNPAPSSAP